MEKKKKVILLVIGVVSLLTVVIGASYAYFTASVTGTGNDNGSSSITTAELPNLVYNNGENFSGTKVYPGYKNIHTFTVSPQPNSKGNAVYVLHLNANVPTEFGRDIKVAIYKTTDKINNNLSRTEGVLTPVPGANGEYRYSKSDTIITNGTLEKVYESSLETNTDIILEEKEFNETLLETTYFLVYEYVETSVSQDAAQGKMFSGKVTVSLKRELTGKNIPEFIRSQVVTSGSGVYEVTHDDAIIESPLNEEEKNNLKQTEYRYAGVNPNNYVMFNNELWRIIGLVNTPSGSRVKLIRNESIGKYSWDSSEYSINEGDGVNEWSQADLMKLLNPGYETESIGGSLYWNKKSGNCYKGSGNINSSCDFNNSGLSIEAQSKIDTITWTTGTNGSSPYFDENNGLTKHFYNYERSNNTGKMCNTGDSCTDNVLRTTTWNGKVGFLAPSDYGYATIGGTTMNREKCLNFQLVEWKEDFVSDCINNDWIFIPSTQWTINTNALAPGATSAYYINGNGNVDSYGAYNIYETRPSVYLTLQTRIINGDGSQSNPFTLF